MSLLILRQGSLLPKHNLNDFGGNACIQYAITCNILNVDPKSFDTIISGGVNREGIFEILPGETIQQALQYAGGFSD